MSDKVLMRLIERLIEAEQRAAKNDADAKHWYAQTDKHHRVPTNHPLPANCEKCGGVLVRDFR